MKSLSGSHLRQTRGEVRAAEIINYLMSKLNHDEPVQMEVMLRLHKVFHYEIGDLTKILVG